MSFRRYIASTVREGLDRVRRELGDDAVILSNKRLGPGRIEIVAAAADSMQALVEEADRPGSAPRASAPARERARSNEADASESFQDFIRRQTPAAPVRTRLDVREATPRARAAARPEPAPARSEAAPPRSEAALTRPEPASPRGGVAMYHEVASAQLDADAFESDSEAFEPLPVTSAPARFARVASPAPAAPAASQPAPARRARPAAASPQPAAPLQPAASQAAASPAVFRQGSMFDEETAAEATVAAATAPSSLAAPPMRPAGPPAPPSAPQPAVTLQVAPAAGPMPASLQTQALSSPIDVERDDTRVMTELRSLRAALSDRIAALESNIALNRPRATGEAPAPRNTAATRVMTRLLMSGFSPELSRRVAAHAPATDDIVGMDSWLHQVVTGNLRCAPAADGLLENQGAIALVGPTGVGKTTTVAKLAARFAVRHGSAQLGLITLDSYRIGAHEQLRSYGRILGVPTHVAQDGATLRELLSSLQGKRLVLIDTCGLSQRDERLEEMLGTLNAARFNLQPIRRILLLNAASQAETLDEVARAWRASDAAGSILTKLDEAARIGGAVDCLLRYRMTLYGLTNGQRVPEDWHPAGARLIAHVALKPSTSPFTLGNEEAQALAGQMQGGVPA
ncbi:MAG TPA: flagellar biosynthesis protein FlhF [Burkholderiaceae bacterium]|nr:flagellar biosynthesis protein FlhF [Burkholderiaceae bacterium]